MKIYFLTRFRIFYNRVFLKLNNRLKGHKACSSSGLAHFYHSTHFWAGGGNTRILTRFPLILRLNFIVSSSTFLWRNMLNIMTTSGTQWVSSPNHFHFHSPSALWPFSREVGTKKAGNWRPSWSGSSGAY